MESFLVEQQSSSKCTEFMKPLSGDELMPIRRGTISKKVQEFKERYDSDTESDEEDDDTYPTEFYRGEMESFLTEQQSSSKCTDFMRPLAEEESVPISRGPLSKKSQKFERQSDWDSDSEEESNSYTTVNNPNEMKSLMEEQVKPLSPAINHQSIEIIEIDDDDDDDKVAIPSAIAYSANKQETKLSVNTDNEKIKNILTGCKQLTHEIIDSVFKCISLKHQLMLKLFVVDSTDKFQCCVQDHRKPGIQFDLSLQKLRNHIRINHKINVKSIVELQCKNNNDKITQMLNEPSVCVCHS